MKMEVSLMMKYVYMKRLSNKKYAVERAKIRAKKLMRRKEMRKQTKQRRMLMFLLCNFLLSMSISRVVWEYERSTEWWEKIVNQTFTNWLNNFSMSRSTGILCNEKLRRKTQK